MSSSSEDGLHDSPTPFLLHLFYRTGSFYRPEDLGARPLPPHVTIYTWPKCSLGELAMELAALIPSALPYPAVGTRLAFQLIHSDVRRTNHLTNKPHQYVVKDLGSIVIGQGGPGSDLIGFGDVANTSKGFEQENGKTLKEARYVVGDFVSCAILPTQEDGSVAPVSVLRRDDLGRGHRLANPSRENGLGYRVGRRDSGSGVSGLPMGEWRRGEALPDAQAPRTRASGRW